MTQYNSKISLNNQTIKNSSNLKKFTQGNNIAYLSNFDDNNNSAIQIKFIKIIEGQNQLKVWEAQIFPNEDENLQSIQKVFFECCEENINKNWFLEEGNNLVLQLKYRNLDVSDQEITKKIVLTESSLYKSSKQEQSQFLLQNLKEKLETTLHNNEKEFQNISQEEISMKELKIKIQNQLKQKYEDKINQAKAQFDKIKEIMKQKK